ncbi:MULTISPECIES: hypothetical protein [unclassified Prochlorococcus]|uniref:hypothetical protein n=1 Tax=unclassified Prochlorococcus TaxID=2627481 RepID=UPI000533A71E|nr:MULTISPECIES: hypothetical protein [unclassified Prochlorococcus]KGG16612.1 hypothetical protein EV06_0454 [Prochlorococcus sp. MIT 0602]KGG18416.1 hypothetical protein EV07_0332 [Prochlorococcus sp. MIT 0603]
MLNPNSYYNNADSFAIVFDEAWRSSDFVNDEKLTVEEKIRMIIDQNKEHPYIKSSPSEAFNVAKFRLRLLQLQ